MNNLTIINYEGINVADSRDVAEMVGKSHNELLKDIRKYLEYLAKGEIALGEFFIETSYKDKNNQERPCY